MANAVTPGSAASTNNKTEATGSVNWFGAPPNNSNRQPVPHQNWFQTQDATAGTNLISPLALTTAVIPLVIPQNAVTVTLIGDGIIRVSEQPTMAQYASIPLGLPLTLDVARLATLYVAAATTANLSFIFQTL